MLSPYSWVWATHWCAVNLPETTSLRKLTWSPPPPPQENPPTLHSFSLGGSGAPPNPVLKPWSTWSCAAAALLRARVWHYCTSVVLSLSNPSPFLVPEAWGWSWYSPICDWDSLVADSLRSGQLRLQRYKFWPRFDTTLFSRPVVVGPALGPLCFYLSQKSQEH